MRKVLVYIYQFLGRDEDAMRNRLLHLHIAHKEAQREIEEAIVAFNKVKALRKEYLGALKRQTLDKTAHAVNRMHSKHEKQVQEVEAKYGRAMNQLNNKKGTIEALKQAADDIAGVDFSIE